MHRAYVRPIGTDQRSRSEEGLERPVVRKAIVLARPAKGVAGWFYLRHLERMSETATYPYTFVIIPPKTDGGSYQWAIRKNGKLVQRSDRNFRSEDKAREHALAEIEKLLSGAGER